MAEQPKRINKCSICHEPGHNKAKCKMAEAKPVETKPKVEQSVWVVMAGGSTKDWKQDNYPLSVCASLRDVADAINERIEFYMKEEVLDEDDKRRKVPVFVPKEIEAMIKKEKFNHLVQIVNIKADPDEEKDS